MFNVKKEAVALVLKYFGSQAAGLYETYYAEKNDTDIIKSVEKLLKGFIGEEKTEAEMTPFYQLHNEPNL